jgi:predicted nucleotidyltransferase
VIGDVDVRRAVESIVALSDPDRVCAFGSYAKGTLHEGSDVDLLVIGPSHLPRVHRGRDVMAALAGIAARFDILFVTPRELAVELADPHSLISSVLPGARTLYERPP